MVNTRLSWARAGSGEPLLLLHGIGTTRDDFASLRPALEAGYDVFAVDLPGHGDSPALSERPTIRAVTDVIEADLDLLGMSRMHVLGNSIGARIALELARRDRALSVLSIAPSGLNLLPERIYQGAMMSTFRLLISLLHPAIEPLAQWPAGRAALLTGLRSQPWLASEVEVCASREGVRRVRGLLAPAVLGHPGRHPNRARRGALSSHPGPGHRRHRRQRADPPLPAGRPGRNLPSPAWRGSRAPV